jgi:hypothetical protein
MLLSGLLVAMVGLLIWQLPRIHQYGSRAVTFVIYVVVGLIAAVITFGVLRSFGNVRGQQLGMAFEFGGAAALFVVVLLLGLHFESSSVSSFSVTLMLHEQGDKSRIVTKDGKITLYLPEGAKTFEIQRGATQIQDLAPEDRGITVRYLVEVEGYSQVPLADALTLIPSSRMDVPLIKGPILQKLAGVIWDDNREPVAEVEVYLPEFDLTTSTDHQGKFLLQVQATPQRQVRLIARKAGYEPRQEDPTLGNTSLSFVLRRRP